MNMKALFGRKISTLEDLRDLTERALADGARGSRYRVIREVILEEKDFRRFAGNFLRDQPWILEEDGGPDPEHQGALRCIRVINQSTGERVLVNTEGYLYYAEKVIMQSPS